jgi:hypothetical protein
LQIPASRLRAGKKYVRVKGDTILDPGELRATDLGFLCVTITDLISDSNPIVIGDLFVKYTVEFHGPRIGSQSSLCGHSNTKFVSGHAGANVDGVVAPFGVTSDWTKQYNSTKNTLDYDIGYDASSYQYAGTAGGAASLIRFNQPFTGLMTAERHSDAATNIGRLIVNGSKGIGSGYSTTQSVGQPLKAGVTDHPWRHALTDLVHTVKDGATAVKDVWSIIADVGDVLHLTGEGIADGAQESALWFTEASEEMLPVFAGLLV